MKNLVLILTTAVITSFCFYFFSCNQKAPKNTKMEENCKGYAIHTAKLPKFMKDSLTGNNIRFDGGFLFKSDLQDMLNACQGNVVSVLIGGDTTGGKFEHKLYMIGNQSGFIEAELNDSSGKKPDCCIPVIKICCPQQTFLKNINPKPAKFQYELLPDSTL